MFFVFCVSSIVNMTGDRIPTANYLNSINENFPSPNRNYKIDNTIANRYVRDLLPVNANLDGSSIQDGYIEFILNGSNKEFVNLDSLHLELKIKPTLANGDDIGDDTKISVIDGLGATIISKVYAYLNSCPIENNSNFGLWQYIKTLVSSDSSEQKNIGKLNYYKSLNTKIVDTVTANYFADTSLNKDEAGIISNLRNGLHTMIPLKLDISNSDFYLLDSVELRLRFDLNPASYVFLCPETTTRYKYRVELAKLHVEKIIPHNDVLIGLNSSMINSNREIEYIFERPIIKTYIMNTGINTLTIDNVMNGSIPSKLYMFFISQNASSGSYNRNPLYLNHCSVNNIRLDVNGSVHSQTLGSFPNNVAQFLTNTLKNSNSKENLISLSNFKEGRSLFVYDLNPSLSSDCLNLDRKGNLRVSIECSNNVNENMNLYIIGVFNGLISVNSERRVETTFLM